MGFCYARSSFCPRRRRRRFARSCVPRTPCTNATTTVTTTTNTDAAVKYLNALKEAGKEISAEDLAVAERLKTSGSGACASACENSCENSCDIREIDEEYDCWRNAMHWAYLMDEAARRGELRHVVCANDIPPAAFSMMRYTIPQVCPF